MRKTAKFLLITSLCCSFLTIAQTSTVEAKFVFRGGNVYDSSRYKQMVEWVKKEQEKLNQLKAKLQHTMDTVKQAQQAMHSVKTSIDEAMKSVNGLRSNINSVMKMSDGLIRLDLDKPATEGWSEIQYSPEMMHYEGAYIGKKMSNNNIISKANLESQKMASGLSAIVDANNTVIESLQKLGRNTEGLLDVQEVRTEMTGTNADTNLQATKLKAAQLNKQLQEKIIQAENEQAAANRKAKDFQVTSDPEQRTEKENTDLKRLEQDTKPGRGFVEF